MSAIFGIFHRDRRPVESRQLARMSDAMSHRAIDGQSTVELGNAGLGHLMLRTTPQSLFEHLPFVQPSSSLSITCDVRLDNRDDLITLLLPQVTPANNIPDSLILLKAFQKWGEEMPGHLLGDFVFAIWNPGNQSLAPGPPLLLRRG
jgi:asparagine synthase (glutamine-hydrolysing)